MNKFMMLSGRVEKSPREGQDELKGEQSPHSEPPPPPPKNKNLVDAIPAPPDSPETENSFLHLLFNYHLSHPSKVIVVGGLGGLVNTAWVWSNICSGYSQKVTFLSSWTRLPPD